MEQNQDETSQFPDSSVDEKTFIVSRTVQSVEEATTITSSTGVDEETATNDVASTNTNTNPTFGGAPSLTQSESGSFEFSEDSDDPGLVPDLIVSTSSATSTQDVWEDVAAEPVEREVVQAYVAPEVIENRPKQREDEFIEVVVPVVPDRVEKSDPNSVDSKSDRAALYKKNQNRAQLNSIRVLVAVVVGFILIGSTIAILIANFK